MPLSRQRVHYWGGEEASAFMREGKYIGDPGKLHRHEVWWACIAMCARLGRETRRPARLQVGSTLGKRKEAIDEGISIHFISVEEEARERGAS